MHDYDPAWDYEMDEKHEEYTIQFAGLKARIIDELVSELDAFDDFELAFVILQGDETLGLYCNGTQSKPVICIDMHNTLRESGACGVTAMDVVETTIVHELGHALQEWHGLEPDCEWAEDFAEAYYMHGDILNIEEV